MRDNVRYMLILSGVASLITAVFFIYSFLCWLNYDSTQTSLYSTFPIHNSADFSMNKVENLQIDQVAIEHNPFVPFQKTIQELEIFPDLCLKGLILGERRLAILEETVPPYRSWIVQEGEEIFGAQVIQINRQQVELSRNDRSIILKTSEGPTP